MNLLGKQNPEIMEPEEEHVFKVRTTLNRLLAALERIQAEKAPRLGAEALRDGNQTLTKGV